MNIGSEPALALTALISDDVSLPSVFVFGVSTAVVCCRSCVVRAVRTDVRKYARYGTVQAGSVFDVVPNHLPDDLFERVFVNHPEPPQQQAVGDNEDTRSARCLACVRDGIWFWSSCWPCGCVSARNHVSHMCALPVAN